MTPLTAFASFLLFVGLVLLGRKRRAGFLFSIAGEVLWTAAALNRGMYDLAVVCAVFGFMAALNFRQWGKS